MLWLLKVNIRRKSVELQSEYWFPFTNISMFQASSSMVNPVNRSSIPRVPPAPPTVRKHCDCCSNLKACQILAIIFAIVRITLAILIWYSIQQNILLQADNFVFVLLQISEVLLFIGDVLLWMGSAHGAIEEMTPKKRSIKNDHMDTSGMTSEKFWYQNFFPHPGLPLNKILKNCWRAPWPARRPEILHAGHWPQYATFIFYTNFCAMKFLLIRFLKNALQWV